MNDRRIGREQLWRCTCLPCRVALRAVNSHMRPGEREAGLLVLRDRKGRRLEAVDGVARFALSLLGRRRKLPVVDVLVAIEAFCESDLVLRRSSGWNVALRALLRPRASPAADTRWPHGFHVEE